jgi:hypothetical protein
MPNPNQSSVFDRWFGPGVAQQWAERLEWERQRWLLHAQRQADWALRKAEYEANRHAWKAQRHAQRAEWRAQRAAYRWAHHPFGAVWGLFWTAFWICFAFAIAFSPAFRTGFINFILELPKYAVHLLHLLMGRAEI